MEVIEIVLLIAGLLVFVLSFVIPASVEADISDTKELAKDEIKDMVSAEMLQIKNQVNDVVEEAVTYAVEKTERSLERLTNEKIMAVNEYSDTVMNEIHKNHEEAMFLYDMLNDKHKNLKSTATMVEKTVKEAEEATKAVEKVIPAFQGLQLEEVTQTVPVAEERKAVELPKEEVVEEVVQDDDPFDKYENIRIQYNQGKDAVEIAKELGLGVGEVKLVIGLYKGMDKS